MIVIICLCGASLLGALTAALVFYRKLVSAAELEKHGRKLMGLVVALVITCAHHGTPVYERHSDCRWLVREWARGAIPVAVEPAFVRRGFLLRVASHQGRGSHSPKVIGLIRETRALLRPPEFPSPVRRSSSLCRPTT